MEFSIIILSSMYTSLIVLEGWGSIDHDMLHLQVNCLYVDMIVSGSKHTSKATFCGFIQVVVVNATIED